jgi:hypothetical protein
MDLEPCTRREFTHQNKVRLIMPAKASGGKLQYGSSRYIRLFCVSITTSRSTLNTMAHMKMVATLLGALRNRRVRAWAVSSKEESPRYTTVVVDGRTDSRLSATVSADMIAIATSPRDAAGTVARV